MGSSLCVAVRKKKKKKKTVVVLPEIPEELLIDILIRLPTKSLMRFKCVSKLWLSLITSRYFTNRFLKPSSPSCLFAYFVDSENQSNYVLLKSSLFSSSHDRSDISLSVIDQHSTIPIMGGYLVNAARGLLCYRTGRRVIVCNPNTRQVVELPIMRSKTNVWNWFGHDPLHDEYKVLSLFWDVNKEQRVVRSELQVLVLGVGSSWRTTQSHHTPHRPFRPYSKGMTINGVLYYIAWTDANRCVLMSFDLSSDDFNLIELPYENLSCTSLMNYQGNVATIENTLLSSDGTVDVCVLEDADKNQWSNKKTFVLPVSKMNFVHGDRLVMGGSRDSGKVLLTKANLIRDQPARFFIYDLERNEITRRIEIRPSLLGSFNKTNHFVRFFWQHIDSIMYLKT
ncbi:F-box-like domain superfamily [Arabidopsis suecica]|uniref:F-box-like domain superfamily n=1 Tax=Arabidopsis suecica TaxID=45249 RepID=A0A8T2A108_ARASU|nr:F-box-like domain superfamily [Arabidopsis suecica]